MISTDTFFPNALRPFRHFADFGGRATRTELLAFWIFGLMLAVFAELALGGIAFESDLPKWLQPSDFILLVFFCPAIALAVRRLHDHGQSGWWVLLGLVPTAAFAWERYRDMMGYLPSAAPLPGAVETVVDLCYLALVLLFWQDEEGANRYGPNPRYGAPAEPEAPPRSAGAHSS